MSAAEPHPDTSPPSSSFQRSPDHNLLDMKTTGHSSGVFMEIIVKNRLRMGPIEPIWGGFMRKFTLLLALLFVFGAALSATAAKTDNLNFKPQFVFKDRSGKTVS